MEQQSMKLTGNPHTGAKFDLSFKAGRVSVPSCPHCSPVLHYLAVIRDVAWLRWGLVCPQSLALTGPLRSFFLQTAKPYWCLNLQKISEIILALSLRKFDHQKACVRRVRPADLQLSFHSQDRPSSIVAPFSIPAPVFFLSRSTPQNAWPEFVRFPLVFGFPRRIYVRAIPQIASGGIC